MSKFLAALLIVGCMVALCGCESGSSGSSSGVTFVNNASYNVTIVPNGQTGWQTFLLSPGQQRTIDIGTTVYYLYGPTALVQASASGNGTVVTFTNLAAPQ